MRAFLLVLAFVFSSLAVGHSQGGEDEIRRLPRIQVTALPPHMGTVYANAFTLRDQDFARPGYRSMEIRFTPVSINETENVMPDLVDTEFYSIKTNIPPRADNMEFSDSVRDFFTQDIALPSGPYVISEITFRRPAGSSQPDARYCLSDGTLLFEIIGRDTLFLGRLNINYPPNASSNAAQFAPLSQMGDKLTDIRGWRWTTTDLLNFDVRTVKFNPAGVCSANSNRVSAWGTAAISTETYSPSP